MRVHHVLAVAATAWLLVGCGDAEPEDSGDPSGITGTVLLGPQCPVVTEDEPCPDQPAAGIEVTVGRQVPGEAYVLGPVVARTTTDAHGGYRVAVPPGDYVVTAAAGMSCELVDVHVTRGALATADVPCDTGIR